jgi:hypothetical protein
MTRRSRCLSLVAVTLAAWTMSGTAAAQSQGGPKPPRSPVDVNVVGGTVGVTGPVEVTGSVGVTGTVAATQAGEWVTRSAAQPYTEAVAPTCPFLNQCVASFAAVPAGKVLRVTNLQGFVRMLAVTDGIVSLHTDNPSAASIVFVLPLPATGAAYYGPALGLNERVDVVFTAGQVPVIEVGTLGTFQNTEFNRLGLTGTLLPASPVP